jgi:hypothetical protein
MADLDLARLQWHLENLSTRCPTSLIDPLKNVAAAINYLRGLPFPADDEIVPAPEAVASALGVKAIMQCQAAVNCRKQSLQHGKRYKASEEVIKPQSGK